MATKDKILRILVVDDNRDGADTLGLLLEELGNKVHVTYGGSNALAVATSFSPDLMLVDLVMPEMDGCGLAQRLRMIPTFAHTRLVAITGQGNDELKALAIRAGFDSVLSKPVSLEAIKSMLAGTPLPKRHLENPTDRRLPIEEARRIRNERPTRTLTQAESEAAICDGIIRFQEEYLGTTLGKTRAYLIKDMVVVRILGVLTLAERQLSKSLSPEKGRDIIKETRKQLMELARPMLESLVHEVAGVKVLSMHHDISTVTGEEVVIFSLAGVPRI